MPSRTVARCSAAALACALVAGPTASSAEAATYLTPVATITPARGCLALTPGLNGVKVRMVQRRLGLPGSTWETMSPRTIAKVRRFQAAHGLTADGVVGQRTWTALGLAESFCVDRWQAVVALPLAAGAAERRETMIAFARTYLGHDYVWGGAGTPAQGIDCSGLVLQSLYRAGLDPQPISVDKHVLPAYRSSLELYRHPGLRHVKRSKLRRGDLVFYRSNSTGRVNHIGIALGGGRILEAVSGPDTVRIGTVTTYRYGQTIMPTVVRPFV
jgi:hypothetical protein